MEYIGGGSLAGLLKRQPQLPLAQVVAIILELADALARAHHLEILHRDIKPGNILLAEDGTPRLTDFGLARLGNYPAITATGSVLGTFQYLSPEAFYTRTSIPRRYLVAGGGAVRNVGGPGPVWRRGAGRDLVGD